MARRATIAIVAALLLHGGSARAQPTGGEGLQGLRTILLAEWLIPDIRVQLHEDQRMVLSWPIQLIHVRPNRRLAVSPFIEPQVQISNDDLRGLLGARAYLFATEQIAVVAEGAVVLGHDLGTGGVAGGGLMWGKLEGGMPPMGIGVMYREQFFPDGERRRDISLDVVLSTLWMIVGL